MYYVCMSVCMRECVYEENTIVSMHMCFPYLTFFDVSDYFKYMNHVTNDLVLCFFSTNSPVFSVIKYWLVKP